MKTLSSRKIGLIIIVISLLSLGQLLYTTYTDRQITNCQADVNQQFLDTVRDRAKINDGDRDSIRRLVTRLANANTDGQRLEALDVYFERTNQLDKLRQEFKYPDVERSCR